MQLREAFKDTLTWLSLYPYMLPGTKVRTAMQSKGWVLEEAGSEVHYPGQPPVYLTNIFNPEGKALNHTAHEYLAAVRDTRAALKAAPAAP